MRYMLAALLCLASACSATADGPSGAEDVADAATPTDAPAGDVRAAVEPDAAGLWETGLCRGVSGDPDPWCSAAQSRDAGQDGAWCHLRDLRDGDTGLVPWAECLRYAVAGMPADLRPRWAAIAATCTHPPPRCGVGTSTGACHALRVYGGRSVQMYLARATALGRCWPVTQ